MPEGSSYPLRRVILDSRLLLIGWTERCLLAQLKARTCAIEKEEFIYSLVSEFT